VQGRIVWYNWYVDRSNKIPLQVISHSGDEMPTFLFPPKREGLLRWLDFHFFKNGNFTVLAAPHWCFVVAATLLSALPLIRWTRRFSLRTFLFGMTLVAALLGAIVWAVK
jgi:hypothetical protein